MRLNQCAVPHETSTSCVAHHDSGRDQRYFPLQAVRTSASAGAQRAGLRHTGLTDSTLIRTQGKLKGFDQNVNVIITESHERVFSMSEGVEVVPLGLYIVRGDNMYVSNL